MTLSRPELVELRQRWRQASQKVVFTNGCYDLVHPGHVRLLESARALGDRLVVGLNTDSSVRRLKGPLRPILTETERTEIIGSLAAVDAVTMFDDDTPLALLAELLPDVLVKGADWSHWIAGREIVEGAGGRVVALPLEAGFSTTDLVERILGLSR